MPSVQGILETALYVKDIQNSATFYRRIFDFPTLLEVDRLIALNVANRNVLLLFKEGATADANKIEGGTIPGHNGAGPTHFAFSITAADVLQWQEKLESFKVKIESKVTWPGGAESLYFRDPDQNLVELITAGFWKFP